MSPGAAGLGCSSTDQAEAVAYPVMLARREQGDGNLSIYIPKVGLATTDCHDMARGCQFELSLNLGSARLG